MWKVLLFLLTKNSKRNKMTQSHLFLWGDEMPKVSNEYFEQKRKEIVDAAYRVCMKKSITSVEMKDIIAETGLSSLT